MWNLWHYPKKNLVKIKIFLLFFQTSRFIMDEQINRFEMDDGKKGGVKHIGKNWKRRKYTHKFGEKVIRNQEETI